VHSFCEIRGSMQTSGFKITAQNRNAVVTLTRRTAEDAARTAKEYASMGAELVSIEAPSGECYSIEQFGARLDKPT
jgi:hypothetical protein